MSREAARLRGARLCFGKPVKAGGRTVVPVASVLVAGGLGFSDSAGPSAEGGGRGGGTLQAKPVGFIEVADDQARFRRIWTGESVLNTARGLVGLAVVALVAERHLRS
jgi:uncharacterized spore protein YtfJ